LNSVGSNSGSHDTPDAAARRALADEADLIRRCLAGEREAQEQLYRAHRRQVAANLYRVIGDRTDLDDLVQEVFVIAFRGLSRFRKESRLSTWLYRICANVALGRIRSRGRRPLPVPLASPVKESTESSPETPRRALERKQDTERVYRALDRLSPKKRLVLFLHEIQGMDLREVAEIAGAHPVTVRTRLFYARREFYELLASDGEGGSPSR
jgi:RNA polymerase sigma-70 factor (ECF subfamily)